MSTTISAVMVRDRTPAMFDDLLAGVADKSYSVTRANGVTTLLFAADLDDVTVAAIRARMMSRDDADMAARASLASARDAVRDAADPVTLDDALAVIGLLRAAVVDGLDYVLGDAGL